VLALILDRISFYLNAREQQSKAGGTALKHLTAAQLSNLELILSADTSYRDVVVVQMAYGLCCVEEQLDLTKRQPGARSVGAKLGDFLARNHIRAVRDAYQNIGKNSTELARGNLLEFDSFLRWLSEGTRTREEVESAFEYACWKIASTSRPVEKMPALNNSKLTFGAMCAFLDRLFGLPSQGAYQQFAIASLLHSLIEQWELRGYRLETKNLNASDRSSRTAGDIQLLTGNRVIEAVEVTENAWDQKLQVAAAAIRNHDLSRMHILASVNEADKRRMFEALDSLGQDVSVLDVRAFTASMVAILTKPFRALSLERLYELIDRYQPDVNRVNTFVEQIRESGFAD